MKKWSLQSILKQIHVYVKRYVVLNDLAQQCINKINSFGYSNAYLDIKTT